jgi:hypothetical protein
VAKKGQKLSETINELRKTNMLLVVALCMLVILVVFSIVMFASQSQRRAVYQDSPGAAGLSATVDYHCADPCEEKYNFNVYIFADDGRQVSVVRPGSDGSINLALAEGRYVMMVGKLFNEVFPQERLDLKNGKTLELDLKY